MGYNNYMYSNEFTLSQFRVMGNHQSDCPDNIMRQLCLETEFSPHEINLWYGIFCKENGSFIKRSELRKTYGIMFPKFKNENFNILMSVFNYKEKLDFVEFIKGFALCTKMSNFENKIKFAFKFVAAQSKTVGPKDLRKILKSVDLEDLTTTVFKNSQEISSEQLLQKISLQDKQLSFASDTTIFECQEQYEKDNLACV